MWALESDFGVFEGEGTLFGSISKKKFERLKVLKVKPSAVEAFDRFASPIDQRLRCNWEESRTLADLRDTLLPKLLSGEIRVGQAEKQVEKVV